MCEVQATVSNNVWNNSQSKVKWNVSVLAVGMGELECTKFENKVKFDFVKKICNNDLDPWISCFQSYLSTIKLTLTGCV